MDAHDMPKECLNNSQFLMVLKATLETGIKQKQQKLKDVQNQIEAVKKSVEYKYNERKKKKQLYEIEKEKKAILDPTLKILMSNLEEKKFELKLVQDGLDSDSLRMKDEQKKFEEIVEGYKKTWEKCQAEYEKSELAIERKKAKIKVEKAKVQLMVAQFKKDELIKMLKQRETINQMRLKSLITEMSHLVLDRWKQQNHQDEFKNSIQELNRQYKEQCEKYNRLQHEIEEEAKAKALARQLMPAPRVNTSVLQSVYASTSTTEHKFHREPSIAPAFSDTMSVNSSIFEQLYSGNEGALNKIHNETELEDEEKGEGEGETDVKEKEDVKSLKQEKSFCENSQINNIARQSAENLQSKMNTLENVCRQLSIEEELTCDECLDKEDNVNNTTPNRIICEAIIETPRKPQPQQAFSGSASNNLKQKPERNDSMNNILEQPERKRSRMSDCSHENFISSSKLSGLKSRVKESPTKFLPKITKVQKFNQPIKIQIKPPMAEVPPRPSNLFPNRHYTVSCTSSDNLSTIGEKNYHEIDPNWQNFSPPHRTDSGMSFMSDASMFKNMMTPAMSKMNSEAISNEHEVQEYKYLQPAKQPNEPHDFFTCFKGQKKNTQTFF